MQVNTYWLTWAKNILAALKLKPTANRVQFLYAWMAGENTQAKNNPLATTWDMSKIDPGQQNFNWNGGYPVKSYSTPAIGLQATINTLRNGYYPEIMRYLQQDISLGNASALLLQNLGTWGTGTLPLTIWRSWPADFKKKLGTGMAIGVGAVAAVLLLVYRKQIAKLITGK